jgi:hypothetical protein
MILHWKKLSANLHFFLQEILEHLGKQSVLPFSLFIGFYPITFKFVLESPVLKTATLTPDQC